MFDELKHQHHNKLPFVVFRAPNSKLITYYLQNNDNLNTIRDFSEQGFVFAPFNAFDNGTSVLFPLDNCKVKSLDISSKDNLLITNPLDFELSVATDKYLNLVDTALSEINSGHLKKVVLSQLFKFNVQNINALAVFEKMVDKYPTAFVYCWHHPKVGTWLGATPETLLKVSGHHLTTMSLAGTQKYNENKKVVWQKKELEEQQIVTHYILNQLKASGVQSDQITSNEVNTIRAGNLWHLQTKIDAQIDASNFSLNNLLYHLHPTPAVCGEPKSEAYQFIHKHEGYNRQYYTGFLGEINIFKSRQRNKRTSNIENLAYKSVSKTSNLYVNLRCMQIIDNKAVIYVGGGITKDSIPDNEWQELMAKLQTVKSVL